MHDLCPLCRTERIGAFRFCRHCRFDFDALGADPEAPPGRFLPPDAEGDAVGPTPRMPVPPVRGLLALAFTVVVGLAGLSTDAMSNLGSPSSASSSANASLPIENQVAAAPEAVPPGTPSTTATLGAAGPSGQNTRADVVRVIDGQTIVVAFGGGQHEVRYLGISTPATVGRRAKAANAALVAGRTVILEADVSEIDRSGRLLRYVWLQRGARWMLVNLELVRRGLATVATPSPDKKYADRYLAAERHARAGHLGSWGPTRGENPRPGATPGPPKTPKGPKPPKPSKQPVGPSSSDRH